MKKYTLIILTTIALIITTSGSICHAFSSENYLAQVQVDSQLKPEYSPAGHAIADASKGGVAQGILLLLAGSLIYLAGPTAILILAIGGLRYVTARGNQTQMDGAKKTVTYAIIGLIVIVLSLAIITNVVKIFEEIPAATQTAPTP